MAIYVYGVVRADSSGGEPIRGLLEQPVYEVAAGPLAAVVSDYPSGSVRPERKHIAAGQAVMRKLQSERDVLPMAFGTLTQSKEALVDFIERQSDVLSDQLRRVAGCVEMGLRLTLDVPELAAFAVERTPSLKAARDKIYAARRTPSHDEMIRLGQAFDNALKAYREAQSARLVAALGVVCREIQTLPTRDEKDLANLAMLVRRGDLPALEAEVNAIAAVFGDELVFNLSGPWPPYNFVTFDDRLHAPRGELHVAGR